MKISWTFWWVANVFWLILFAVGTVFVWTRKVDGTGVLQTPEAKLLSFIVLLLAFIFPFLIQSVWLIVNLLVKKNKKN